MSGTSFEGPQDVPRNSFETMYVGVIIVFALMIVSIVTGLFLVAIQYLFGLIGILMFIGIPIVLVCALIAGYAWRVIDPRDPFTLR